MRNDTIESFLQSLAARVPAPGGGATAALHAAQAAALVAMVARYSDGPRYAAHAEEVSSHRQHRGRAARGGAHAWPSATLRRSPR